MKKSLQEIILGALVIEFTVLILSHNFGKGDMEYLFQKDILSFPRRLAYFA